MKTVDFQSDKMFAKTILCVIGFENTEVDLARAVTLCLEANAHLSVLILCISALPTIGDYPVGSISVDSREEEAVTIREQEKSARLACARPGLSFDVSSIHVELTWADDEIAERARYTDLVLIGQSVISDETLKWQTVNGTLFAAERPVMLMPGRRPPTLAPRKILLAWDSSSEAGRAAFDMRELFTAADEVHVTMVDPAAHWRKNGEEPGADIARYLARYCANIVVDRISSGGRSIAAAITQHADDIGADLIVMGAYHHSRLRERLLGGTTRTMLDAPPVPILMSR
jgi:nucleotide-binding universal stress UspA family protein